MKISLIFCNFLDTNNNLAVLSVDQDDHYLGPSVDIWAMGILLYFLVTGAMPFKGNTVAALKHAILDGYFEVPDYISSECEELIAGILVRKPANRLSGKEVSPREK